MKRNSISRTSRFSLLLLGAGVGVGSLTLSTYAQASNQIPAVVLSQSEGMTRDCEIDVKESASHDGHHLQVRVPDSIALIELTHSANASRSFRIRMDDPSSIVVSPAADSTIANSRTLQASPQGQSDKPLRTPMDLLSRTDTSGWRQTSSASVFEGLRTPAELSTNRRPDSGYGQTVKFGSNKLDANKLDANKFDANKFDARQETKSGSIVVDSDAFEPHSPPEPIVSQSDAREIEPQLTFKFPPRASTFKSSTSTTADFQDESVQANLAFAKQRTPFTKISDGSKPVAIADGRFSQMQVSASMKQLNQFAPVAIPTTIRPIATVEQADWVVSKEVFQQVQFTEKPSNPIDVLVTEAAFNRIKANEEEISHIKQPEFDLETGSTPAPVSFFIEGPDSLEVNQTGDYRISLVNSSFKPSAALSISLRIPDSAEMLVIDRDAQIDDLERTLTWSIAELASDKQQQIRFRLKVVAAGEVDFPVTVSQDGRAAQTMSQVTIVK